MMNDKLERFVNDHKRDFDQFDPPADLWNKIENQLGVNAEIKKAGPIRYNFLLKIAVTIIPLIIAGFWFYQYQLKQLTELSNIDPVMAKQQVHYASLIEIKRIELKRMEKEEPQLYLEFLSEIKKIDESYQKLKKELPASPNQEETVKAMIRNLKIQTELLNQQLQIIQQIDQLKKEQNNEAQNI